MNKKKFVLALFAVCVAAAKAQQRVPQERMQEIYNEVKTPYKYGVVMEAAAPKDMVDCPTVFRDGDRWCMTYVYYDGRGYETWMAYSDDLLHWTDWTGDVLVRPSEQYDARYAHKSCVLKHNGVVYHFYCAVDNNRKRTIALATSRDLSGAKAADGKAAAGGKKYGVTDPKNSKN